MPPTLTPPTSPLERTPEEWSAVLGGWGEPRYRGMQVFRWIHHRGVFDAAQMTDLSKALRAKLAEETLRPPLDVAHVHESEDGTRKLLVSFADARTVETVLIPMASTSPGDGYAPEDPAGED